MFFPSNKSLHFIHFLTKISSNFTLMFESVAAQFVQSAGQPGIQAREPNLVLMFYGAPTRLHLTPIQNLVHPPMQLFLKCINPIFLHYGSMNWNQTWKKCSWVEEVFLGGGSVLRCNRADGLTGMLLGRVNYFTSIHEAREIWVCNPEFLFFEYLTESRYS